MVIRINKAFTITELLFVVIIVTIFIILLTPFIGNIRTKIKIIACKENLQKIGLGLKLYAKEHQGKFPLGLKELVEGGYVEDEKVFDCPSSPQIGNAEKSDYYYKKDLTILSPSGSAIVFDKINNHKDGKHVLYVSGDIIWEKLGAMAE